LPTFFWESAKFWLGESEKGSIGQKEVYVDLNRIYSNYKYSVAPLMMKEVIRKQIVERG
jgi:hypothetical protein